MQAVGSRADGHMELPGPLWLIRLMPSLGILPLDTPPSQIQPFPRLLAAADSTCAGRECCCSRITRAGPLAQTVPPKRRPTAFTVPGAPPRLHRGWRLGVRPFWRGGPPTCQHDGRRRRQPSCRRERPPRVLDCEKTVPAAGLQGTQKPVGGVHSAGGCRCCGGLCSHCFVP